MGTPGSDKTWGCCALQRSPPLALLLSFLLGLWELQARSLNAARRSGLGTPSTPFSLMTPSLGEFQSGVSTIASTLPVECGGSGYGSGSGEGSGYGQSSVSISFIVRSATTNEDVSGAVVSFALGDIVLATTTDEFGLAIFTFSIDEIVVPEEGIAAIVEVSMENFVTYNYEKIIFAESMMEELLDWNVAIALSPDLADNEIELFRAGKPRRISTSMPCRWKRKPGRLCARLTGRTWPDALGSPSSMSTTMALTHPALMHLKPGSPSMGSPLSKWKQRMATMRTVTGCWEALNHPEAFPPSSRTVHSKLTTQTLHLRQGTRIR